MSTRDGAVDDGFSTARDIARKTEGIDLRVLTVAQRRRFDETESCVAWDGYELPENMREAMFECTRAEMSENAALDVVFDSEHVSRWDEVPGIDFNKLGFEDRAKLDRFANFAASIRFAASHRNFDFVDFKPVDLQGLHNYLVQDVFGEAALKVKRDTAMEMQHVFLLLPGAKELDELEGGEFGNALAPFAAALMSKQTFAYCDMMTKRLFLMALADEYGWDLHFRDMPLSSLRSTLQMASDHPEMLARLMRANVTEVDETQVTQVEGRFVDVERKPGILRRIRDWVDAG